MKLSTKCLKSTRGRGKYGAVDTLAAGWGVFCAPCRLCWSTVSRSPPHESAFTGHSHLLSPLCNIHTLAHSGWLGATYTRHKVSPPNGCGVTDQWTKTHPMHRLPPPPLNSSHRSNCSVRHKQVGAAAHKSDGPPHWANCKFCFSCENNGLWQNTMNAHGITTAYVAFIT
jgi:hypothetical protein